MDDNGGKRLRLGISYVSFLKPCVRSKLAVPRRSFLGSGLLWGLRRHGLPAVVLSSLASRHGGGGLAVRLLVEEVGGFWVEAVTELFGRDLGLGFGVHGLGLARTLYGLCFFRCLWALLFQVFRAWPLGIFGLCPIGCFLLFLSPNLMYSYPLSFLNKFYC